MTTIKIIGNLAVFISGFMAFFTGVGLISYGIRYKEDKNIYPGAVIFGATIIISYGIVIVYVYTLLNMLNGR